MRWSEGRRLHFGVDLETQPSTVYILFLEIALKTQSPLPLAGINFFPFKKSPYINIHTDKINLEPDICETQGFFT